MGLIALGALTVTSCSNDEVMDAALQQEAKAIQFSTYLGRDVETKGAELTTNGLQGADKGFGVFAYYTAQKTWDNAKTSATPNFMYNQKVTCTDGTNWTYSPVKYWPNNVDDKVSFFAYAPHKETGVTVSGKDAIGAPTVTFAVQGAVANQKDLTVAVAKTDENKLSIGEKVTFTFKHVLARIGLNVEAQVDLVDNNETGNTDTNTSNGTLDGSTTIKVTKVELIGKFDTEATIDLGADLTTDAWVDATVTTDGSEVTYIWSADNFESVADAVTTASSQLNKADSYAMIIPQNMSAIKIRVTYTVTTIDSALHGGSSEIENVITSDEFAFNFKQGKAYMFNLHLGMTSVKVSGTVSAWDTSEPETVVNVPINKN